MSIDRLLDGNCKVCDAVWPRPKLKVICQREDFFYAVVIFRMQNNLYIRKRPVVQLLPGVRYPYLKFVEVTRKILKG